MAQEGGGSAREQRRNQAGMGDDPCVAHSKTSLCSRCQTPRPTRARISYRLNPIASNCSERHDAELLGGEPGDRGVATWSQKACSTYTF